MNSSRIPSPLRIALSCVIVFLATMVGCRTQTDGVPPDGSRGAVTVNNSVAAAADAKAGGQKTGDTHPSNQPEPKNAGAKQAESLPAVKQTIKLEVEPKSLPSLTQKITMDVKAVTPKRVDVPLKVAVTPSDAKDREIALTVRIVPTGELKVPITLQPSMSGGAAGGLSGASLIHCDCSCCRTKDGESKGQSGTKTGDESKVGRLTDNQTGTTPSIGYGTLLLSIFLAGVVGGIARWLGGSGAKYDVLRDELEHLRDSSPPGANPRSWLEIEREMRRLKYGLVMDIVWGIFAAMLVPAVFIISSTDFLNKVQANSAAHVVALTGVCMVAATLGAEFLFRLQHLMRTGSWTGAKETPAAPEPLAGKPPTPQAHP